MLVGVSLGHLADTNLGGANRDLRRGDVAVSADLRDVADRPAFLLIGDDEGDQDFVLVDLLAGFLAILDEYRTFGRERVRVLGDGQEFLASD